MKSAKRERQQIKCGSLLEEIAYDGNREESPQSCFIKEKEKMKQNREKKNFQKKIASGKGNVELGGGRKIEQIYRTSSTTGMERGETGTGKKVIKSDTKRQFVFVNLS